MILKPSVVDRLLLCKALLDPLRYQPMARPDRYTLALSILKAHDAAELALAGIADQLEGHPGKDKAYLMDYFPVIQRICHPDREVVGKGFFSQLNSVRIGIKHSGIFPDPEQWHRVGKNTYDYLADWCGEYLGLELDELDESELITDDDVKRLVQEARKDFDSGSYREALERLAMAQFKLYQSSSAFRGFSVGSARAEEAIKLSAFGVNSNDYLRLQEFLPEVKHPPSGEDTSPSWRQDKFGHPGNWRRDSAEFCIKTFVSLANRIQGAEWIPGPLEFFILYQHKITALKDGAEVWQAKLTDPLVKEKRLIKAFKKGEEMVGTVQRSDRAKEAFLNDILDLQMGGSSKPRTPPRSTLLFFSTECLGEFFVDEFKVTCVPRREEYVSKYFPDLTEIDYQF